MARAQESILCDESLWKATAPVWDDSGWGWHSSGSGRDKGFQVLPGRLLFQEQKGGDEVGNSLWMSGSLGRCSAV